MSGGGDALRRFFAYLLMVAGVVIGGAAGLCTIGFMALFLNDAFRGGSFVEAIVTPLIFGVLPILVGVGLAAAGWALRPKRRLAERRKHD